MTMCSDDIKEHLLKLGYTDALNEINKLLARDKMDTLRWGRYFKRVIDFAKNFGAYDVQMSCDTTDLFFEYHGIELEKLADNLKVHYYEKYDEDGYEEDSEIVVNRGWFENIMHLWINKYQDYGFDIFQQRF